MLAQVYRSFILLEHAVMGFCSWSRFSSLFILSFSCCCHCRLHNHISIDITIVFAAEDLGVQVLVARCWCHVRSSTVCWSWEDDCAGKMIAGQQDRALAPSIILLIFLSHFLPLGAFSLNCGMFCFNCRVPLNIFYGIGKRNMCKYCCYTLS
jgi:hypothetical protein